MKKPAKTKGMISITDLERAMGQKADEISTPKFDPERMCWTREITFKLNPTPSPRPCDGADGTEDKR